MLPGSLKLLDFFVFLFSGFCFLGGFFFLNLVDYQETLHLSFLKHWTSTLAAFAFTTKVIVLVLFSLYILSNIYLFTFFSISVPYWTKQQRSCLCYFISNAFDMYYVNIC